jgi:hypothetical protein
VKQRFLAAAAAFDTPENEKPEFDFATRPEIRSQIAASDVESKL